MHTVCILYRTSICTCILYMHTYMTVQYCTNTHTHAWARPAIKQTARHIARAFVRHPNGHPSAVVCIASGAIRRWRAGWHLSAAKGSEGPRETAAMTFFFFLCCAAVALGPYWAAYKLTGLCVSALFHAPACAH